ncbi:MAG: endonuclease/exonuclease/phosphatase family protein [Bacteroidota bacterium]
MRISRLIAKLALLVNVLLIVALLLSYFSVVISPEKVGFLPLMGLLFPLLILLNLLFVFFWLWRWKYFFLFSTIALFIGFPIIHNVIQLPFGRSDIKNTPQQEQMKVVSYNVRLFNLYDWANNTDAAEQILNLLQEESAGIICLQEFYVNHNKKLNLPAIKHALGSTPNVHIAASDQGESTFYGIATFTKYPIVNRGEVHFENTTNITIYTDIKVGSDTLRVFNNHLQSIRFKENNYSFIRNSKNYKEEERIREIKDISFRLIKASKKRAHQADVLAAYISKSPHKVIVCGDFNDTPVSYTYKTIKNDLNDAFRAYGKWVGTTYQGNFPSYRIDYILYDNQLDLIDYRVKKSNLSDHYPIIGIFKKPQSPNNS